MFVLANMWFQTLMRQFFFNIDKIVFNFISTIYDFLIEIARTSVLSQSDIIDMADRIYKMLAIFMIFKVTFSLIMYVVNPDDFTDKNKGISKLGTNIIISLSLLILTPYVFNLAYQLQTIILEDNSLSVLIFGEANEQTNESAFNSAGDSMAYITMSPFFVPNVALEGLNECSILTVKDGKNGYKFNSACEEALMSYTTNEDGDENTRFSEQTLKTYVGGVTQSNLGLLFRQDMAIATDAENTDYIMDYKYIFSTVVGIVVILLLVTFCLDVALRSIKLAFLQLIAPIPIISYIDPKSGKDGMFKKWYEMCFKTYISLFIRLLALYFVAYIVSRLDRMVDIVDGSYTTNKLVQIFIIIGALMFAKQLPKILEGLGIKLDGGFTLNPLKKIENDMIGGKQVSKIGKGVGKYAGRAAKGVGTAALVGGASAVTGHGFRGVGKAFMGSMKGEKFGKNFSNSYAAAKARDKQVEEMKADGTNPFEVFGTKAYNAFHGTTRAEHQSRVGKRFENVDKSWDDITATIDAVDKKTKALKAVLEGINQAGASAYTDKVDATTGRIITAAEQFQEKKMEAESKLDARRNLIAADLSQLDDGSGGAAGGQAARAKIAQIISTRDKEIDAINAEKLSYTDENGRKITIKLDKTADAKVVSKDAKGKFDAWKVSDEYVKTETNAKYAESKK